MNHVRKVRRITAALVIFAGALSFAGVASAQQGQPPVNLLVGFPAGGNVDSVARHLATGMQNALGRSVVVDNRPGAGGQIAMQLLARSAHDGRTLMLSNEHAVSIIPMTVRNVGYDPLKDFVPVATVTTLPLALAVHPSVKANNIQELVAWAKARNEPLNVGIPAPASQPDFAVGLLAKRFDIKAAAVPYRGGAPMVADLMGGHVLAGLTGISEFLPHQKAGAIRIIAVSGPERLARLPGVPTFSEGGLPGFEERTFMGVFAPAGTPPEVITRYREAIRSVVATPAYRQALDELGLQAFYGDGTDLEGRVRHTTQTWGQVIRDSGFVSK